MWVKNKYFCIKMNYIQLVLSVNMKIGNKNITLFSRIYNL